MRKITNPYVFLIPGRRYARTISGLCALSGMLILSGCSSGNTGNPPSPTSSSESSSEKTVHSSSDSTKSKEVSSARAASTTESAAQSDTNAKGPATATPSSPSSTSFPPGTWLAGSDLPAGTYLIEQDTGIFPGRVLLTSDDSGSLASVLDDIGFYNRLYLTIRDGEYIQFEGTARPADTVPPYEASDDIYPSGMYLVGKDLAPGIYEISCSHAGTAGSYSISADARGNMSSFYQRTTISEPVMQVLEDGQYISLNGAVIYP